MSDPFPPNETTRRATLECLRTLAKWRYPVVISTKSALFAEPEYLALLRDGRFMVQVSFATTDDHLSAQIERGTPSPSSRFEALGKAAEAGIPTSIRHQPVIPGHEHQIELMVSRASGAGVLHYAAEFLKLGNEDSERQALLERQLPAMRAFFNDAVRVGREWILRPEYRLPWVLEARRLAHGAGMTFGAADTDLLPLSDGAVCCSGADLHMPQPGTFFDRNYLTAVRRSSDGLVTHSAIGANWSPSGSVARFVNSDGRVPGSVGAPIAAYIDRNWNGRPNGASPAMFFGVDPAGSSDGQGFATYELAPWLRAAMAERWSASVNSATSTAPTETRT